MVKQSLWIAVVSCLVFSLAMEPPAAIGQTSSPETGRQIDFERDVYPILRRACLECHGERRQESDLRLDQREAALDFGVIEAGDPDNSELLRRIALPQDDSEVMPPIGQPLPKKQILVVRKWIEQGANWPDDMTSGDHWAYVSPRRPKLPEVARPAWCQNPIDHFVLHRLESEGLTPAPQAAPEKLVRRLYLDLIGLPPSPQEVDEFAANPSVEQYEAMVDELLARPQFGERWARSWLDLARYADSHGFQRDNLRDIWAYRDWVIQALNQDMPFDQFTIEQIAGDLLLDASESQRIATGFHRCAPTNVEAGSLPEETRIEQVIDRVNTTGAVWLGTTLECCQCHDHKYDPFTMKDYYQLLAYFNSTELEADRTDPKKASSIQFKGPSMPLSNPERDRQRATLRNQLEAAKQRQAVHRSQLANDLDKWATELAEEFSTAPRTHTLSATSFDSSGTTDAVDLLEDGTILLRGGDPPDKDVYTVVTRTSLQDIRAFRLDALRHDSLPGKGPGRGDPTRRNFVLTDFAVSLRSGENAKASNVRLEFSGARASFSQKNWEVEGAVDDDPRTGWAISPQFDRSHRATFILKEPLHIPAGAELVFKLTQDWGRARTIGCLKLSAVTGNVDAETLPDEIAMLAAQPAAKWSKQERRKLIDFRSDQDPKSRKLATDVARLEKQLAKLKPDTTLVMIELAKPRPTHILERGNYRQPGEPVQPATPEVLHPLTKGPANRLTLARWLVTADNPLVARVTVNRWWAELFGHGIVSTVEDFGVKGESPTHPELLDWLAVEFHDNGWSMKQLLKTIVMSATYQQSSRVSPDLLSRDDRNLLLARGPRFRMDAEMIRDNALAMSGLLDLKQFGPPIRPYQPDGIWRKVGGTAYSYEVSPGTEQYRRGIYIVLKRGSPYPSLINFDANARLACTVKRSRTNTPLQALTLLNDPVYVEAADAIGQRVLQEAPDDSMKSRINYTFQICTARRPRPAEFEILKEFIVARQSFYRSQDDKIDAVAIEKKSWQDVATVMLNLHETITKD